MRGLLANQIYDLSSSHDDLKEDSSDSLCTVLVVKNGVQYLLSETFGTYSDSVYGWGEVMTAIAFNIVKLLSESDDHVFSVHIVGCTLVDDDRIVCVTEQPSDENRISVYESFSIYHDFADELIDWVDGYIKAMQGEQGTLVFAEMSLETGGITTKTVSLSEFRFSIS